MEVEFHPDAAAEITAASAFYEGEAPGLGDALIVELERVVELLRQHPSIGIPIDEILRRVMLVRAISARDIHREEKVIYDQA